MKIGIVLHSHTGNTKNVALRVEEELKSRGHDVVIEKLIPVDEEGSLKGNCKIQSSPDLTPYEMVVFAAPVWAFNLSGVMKEYLEQVETLEGKKVMCFVTKHLPSKAFGGSKSVKTIQKMAEEKGGQFLGSGIVTWGEKKREARIKEFLEQIKKNNIKYQ